jgi:histone H3/H4
MTLIVAKALKEIKYYQKQSDCLFFPKSTFRAICREIAGKLPKLFVGDGQVVSNGFTGGRFNVEAIIALQMVAENYLSDYFAMAYLPDDRQRVNDRQECAFHRKAKTVTPKDMGLVRFFYNALGSGERTGSGRPKTVP